MREIIRNILKEVAKEKETEKFIKCRECKKKFTQTIYKSKKSLPVCPYCGAHNTEKKEIDESDEKNTVVRRHIYSLSDEVPKIVNLIHDGFVSSKSFCKAYNSYHIFSDGVKNIMYTRLVSQFPKGTNLEGTFNYADKLIDSLFGEEIKSSYDKWCNRPKRGSVREGFTDILLKKLRKYPFHEYQKPVDNFMNLQKLKINEEEGILKETHLEKPSGEVVIKVKDSLEKKGKVIYVSWKLMQELESYISAPGLIICVARWVGKKLKLDDIKGWEIFLD